MRESDFLSAIAAGPSDQVTRLALADWLEERDDPRGELLRLTQAILDPHCLRRQERESRVQALLANGIRPCWPTLTNSIGMQFSLIPPGTFLMGSPQHEEGRHDDETQHQVTLTKDFWMGVTPVTQAQWLAVMDTIPSHFRGPNRPVEQVSWDDCQEFCKRLGEREGVVYCLPTEAQWEYACRAGTTTRYHSGDSEDDLKRVGWYADNSDNQTHPVGQLVPNAFGLYDMHGNVWEWCQDWYGPYEVSASEVAATDPFAPVSGSLPPLGGDPVVSFAAARGAAMPGRVAAPSATGSRLPSAIALSAGGCALEVAAIDHFAPVAPFVLSAAARGSPMPGGAAAPAAAGKSLPHALSMSAGGCASAWTDPQGPKESQVRVIRGGSWFSLGRWCRAAIRGRLVPGLRDSFVGFRVGLALD